MQRIAMILAVGCLVSMCSWRVSLAAQPPIREPLPPDATDINKGVGWWELTLIYRTPHSLDEWYFPLVRQLEAAGWTRRQQGYTGRPLPLVDPVAYERRTALDMVVLWERVELHGDLHGAEVRIRRWISLASPGTGAGEP